MASSFSVELFTDCFFLPEYMETDIEHLTVIIKDIGAARWGFYGDE